MWETSAEAPDVRGHAQPTPQQCWSCSSPGSCWLNMMTITVDVMSVCCCKRYPFTNGPHDTSRMATCFEDNLDKRVHCLSYRDEFVGTIRDWKRALWIIWARESRIDAAPRVVQFAESIEGFHVRVEQSRESTITERDSPRLEISADDREIFLDWKGALCTSFATARNDSTRQAAYSWPAAHKDQQTTNVSWIGCRARSSFGGT